MKSIGETSVEMDDQRSRPLRDYALPNASGAQTSIARPTINANNFEIEPWFIQMVQQSQFGGNAIEDLNTYLTNFMNLCDTIKINGVNDQAIKPRLFPFHFVIRQRYGLNLIHLTLSHLGVTGVESVQ